MFARLSFAALAAALGTPLLQGQTPQQADYFEQYIRPVLAEQCYVCHSSKSPVAQGGLRLDTKADVLKGGHSGPAVIPGKPGQSRLIQALTYQDQGLKMPPMGRLPLETIERFRRWVEMGAPDPRDERAEAPAPVDERLEHWAFKLPITSSGKSSIDDFIDERLRAEGLQASPRADKRTLLRRVYYDLIGLPPTFEDILAFESDTAPDAFAGIVDRLLDSPQFGERWGRYWLDIARYADEGFQARPFPIAWSYRDWVIEALNDDMPFDRFVRMQLAADLDPEARREDLRALGLLTVGINLPRPTDVPENLDDRIDVVSRGFLGLSVACARCHDHKFDPIPTSDYYSLYGVFLNAPDRIEPIPIVDAPPLGKDRFYVERLAKRRSDIDRFQQERLEAHRAEFRSQEWLAKYLLAAWDGREMSNTQLEAICRERDLNLYVLKRWRTYLNDALDSGDTFFSGWQGEPVGREQAEQQARLLVEASRPEPYQDAEREALRQILWGEGAPTNVPFEDFRWVMNEGDSNVVKNLKWQYNGVFFDWGYSGGPNAAMGLTENEEIEPAFIFVRGNQFDKGAEVERRFLTALSETAPDPFSHGSGRLELARAIATDKNPLTARVIVNRAWQHLFGYGLVRTPSDFGLRGDPPTHPELLDHLAVRFMENGWSLKRLIREMTLSEAYSRSSADQEANRVADPENRLLWRANRRRLDFEALRDSLLSVAGRLTTKVGGPSFALGSTPAEPRRSVYAYISREEMAGLLKSFDFSNPEQHTAERQDTTVPQQALFLMNSPFVVEQTRYAVERACVAALGPRDGVRKIYELLLGRRPTPAELERGVNFVTHPTPASPVAEPPAWSYGYGRLDLDAERLVDFTPLRVFADDGWQGASILPARDSGRARLTAAGGSPGQDLSSAVVRRWTSPIEGELKLSGTLNHALADIGRRYDYSNGIRGWILSSRQGVLGRWTLRGARADTNISGVRVVVGETIDFVVDARDDYESDEFSWAPTIEEIVDEDGESRSWRAADDFRGPQPQPLTSWEQYAQALISTNEVVFVD